MLLVMFRMCFCRSVKEKDWRGNVFGNARRRVGLQYYFLSFSSTIKNIESMRRGGGQKAKVGELWWGNSQNKK